MAGQQLAPYDQNWAARLASLINEPGPGGRQASLYPITLAEFLNRLPPADGRDQRNLCAIGPTPISAIKRFPYSPYLWYAEFPDGSGYNIFMNLRGIDPNQIWLGSYLVDLIKSRGHGFGYAIQPENLLILRIPVVEGSDLLQMMGYHLSNFVRPNAGGMRKRAAEGLRGGVAP